jgi:hypothetical protein
MTPIKIRDPNMAEPAASLSIVKEMLDIMVNKIKFLS